jgi:hypothetical protein
MSNEGKLTVVFHLDTVNRGQAISVFLRLIPPKQAAILSTQKQAGRRPTHHTSRDAPATPAGPVPLQPRAPRPRGDGSAARGQAGRQVAVGWTKHRWGLGLGAGRGSDLYCMIHGRRTSEGVPQITERFYCECAFDCGVGYGQCRVRLRTDDASARAGEAGRPRTVTCLRCVVSSAFR